MYKLLTYLKLVFDQYWWIPDIWEKGMFMHTMIVLTKDEVSVNNDNQFVLDTHNVKPFPDNQGHLTFPAKGSDLIRCLEDTVFSVRVHFVLKHCPSWDYSATMSLQNYQMHSAFKPDGIIPELYPASITDIDPEKEYSVTCYGGTGYVYIREEVE